MHLAFFSFLTTVPLVQVFNSILSKIIIFSAKIILCKSFDRLDVWVLPITLTINI